ncbi:MULTISPECIES: glycosyltransferase family 4 protein [Photobacterium]|uniref:Glycosyl transferases group 1 n=1 Tax=Photobacterium malacitanum TaxID=2204294 RepID=A0A1Y6MNK9_9GAMM|nr:MULTISPECIES: glycosyltransferase family 4 protein [Photobacterium]SMY38165.1 Glycosyl transferases group 1 [Photobacterium malacitanum]
MKKILMFTKYSRMGASSRLRTFQYIPFLESNEFQVTVSYLFDDKYLSSYYSKNTKSVFKIAYCYFKRFITLFSVKKYHLIYIEKELFPYLPSLFEWIMSILNINYIVDYDDAIFHNYDSSNNKLVRFMLSKKIDKVMKYAKVVIVGNNYIYQHAELAGAKNIELIPTVVDISRYPRLHKKLPCGQVTIGWIGSPYTQKYILQIKSNIIDLLKNKKYKMVMIGANKDIVNHFPYCNIEVLPWSEDSEVSYIQKFDLGIMPIPDENFEKGKCGYKLIQYMACGIPVVASSVGTNENIINHLGCGLLINEKNSWYDSINRIVDSDFVYEDFSRKARLSVEDKYSLQIQQDVLLKIISKVA